MRYSNQQVYAVCSCPGTKNSQGSVVADTNEVQGDLFSQYVG